MDNRYCHGCRYLTYRKDAAGGTSYYCVRDGDQRYVGEFAHWSDEGDEPRRCEHYEQREREMVMANQQLADRIRDYCNTMTLDPFVDDVRLLCDENQRLCIIASDALRLLRERDAETEASWEAIREWSQEIGAGDG